MQATSTSGLGAPTSAPGLRIICGHLKVTALPPDAHATRALEEASLGAIAAACACLVTNPLDVARVRLQLSHEASAPFSLAAPFSLIRNAVRDEGLRAVSHGLGFSLAYNMTLNATRFAAFYALSESEQGLPKPVSGALAGLTAGFIAAPFAKARALRQRVGASPGQPGYISPWRALSTRPMHGSLSWAVRNGGHSGVIFTVYDRVKTAALETWPAAPATVVHVAASLVAAAVSALAMNPVEVVATRMFNQSSAPRLHTEGVPYASPLDCVRRTVAEEGVRALYRGLAASIMRIVPHTVLTFTVMETLRRRLHAAPYRYSLPQIAVYQPQSDEAAPAARRARCEPRAEAHALSPEQPRAALDAARRAGSSGVRLAATTRLASCEPSDVDG